MLITGRFGQTFQHKLLAALSYGSGDRFLIVDCPWQSPSDPFYNPNAVFAYREVNSRHYYGPNAIHPGQSPWREVFGDFGPINSWAQAANVGDQAKIKNRRWTKLDPSTMPNSIACMVPSSCAGV